MYVSINIEYWECLYVGARVYWAEDIFQRSIFMKFRSWKCLLHFFFARVKWGGQSRDTRLLTNHIQHIYQETQNVQIAESGVFAHVCILKIALSVRSREEKYRIRYRCDFFTSSTYEHNQLKAEWTLKCIKHFAFYIFVLICTVIESFLMWQTIYDKIFRPFQSL